MHPACTASAFSYTFTSTSWQISFSDRRTDTQNDYSNPCACAPRVNLRHAWHGGASLSECTAHLCVCFHMRSFGPWAGYYWKVITEFQKFNELKTRNHSKEVVHLERFSKAKCSWNFNIFWTTCNCWWRSGILGFTTWCLSLSRCSVHTPSDGSEGDLRQ